MLFFRQYLEIMLLFSVELEPRYIIILSLFTIVTTFLFVIQLVYRLLKIIYNKNLTRLDRLADDIYGDGTLWKIILWANPEYDCEYDIPDNTNIRIPWPKMDVVDEVTKKIINNKNLG